MNAELGPTYDDLQQVYRASDPRFAGHQQAEAVVVGVDGITVLCSANSHGDGEHTWLIQLADDGGLRWERHYALSYGVGHALAAYPGGGFVIAGDVQRGEMAYRACLLRVRADGEVLQSAAFGSDGVTGFNTVVVLTDGSLLAGGTAERKGWLMQADGVLRATWDRQIGDSDQVTSLVPLADSGFALAALLDQSTTTFGMACLASFSGDQRVRWQLRLPTEGRAEPAALIALPGGGMAVAGYYAAHERAAAQLWVVQVDAKGEVVWERLLGPAEEERRGRAIVSLANGCVVVAGDAVRDSERSLRLACLAADGAVVWERSYGGGERAQDIARGLACTADSGLVLVGSTMTKGPGKTNVWILRLDAEGRLLWDRAFGGA